MSEVSIKELSEKSTRIVVTQNREFNLKRKKENIILADIGSRRVVREFCLKIDISRNAGPDWMTMPQVYLNFFEDKLLVFSLGVLFYGWVRGSSWDADYPINNAAWFYEWLLENRVSFCERDS